MRTALRILIGQALATALLALISVWWSAAHAVSALAGGAIAAMAYASVSFWVLRAQRSWPGAELARLYAAAFVKLASAATLFGALFALEPPAEPLALFLTFLIVQWVPALAGGDSCQLVVKSDVRRNSHLE